MSPAKRGPRQTLDNPGSGSAISTGAAGGQRQGSTAQVRPLRPTGRGWRGRGRGYSSHVQAPPEWRGTTVQVCGLWPFAIGTGSPMVGVPLGRVLTTDATLCCDPVSWFDRARLISNPSAFVLALPGLGKSTMVNRMAIGLAGYGVMPIVLGDIRPDYVASVQALGGQVIPLGPGRGYLNVLDPGEATDAAARLRAAGHAGLAEEVMGDAHARRHTMVATLLTISRNEPLDDREETMLDRALKVLQARHTGIPVLADLLKVIQDGPAEVRAVALDRGDDKVYQQRTERMEASLIGLVGGGRLGETFSQQTTNPMRMDRPVVYDLSGLPQNRSDLQAAALMACWSSGFGTVHIANKLADAGLEPRRAYVAIQDELWSALGAGRGMVDRFNTLSRLNRGLGVGQIMISHTMNDLNALPTEEDRMKARGLVERAGMVICGGLPESEMPLLSSAVSLSRAEQTMLTTWTVPDSWDHTDSDTPRRGPDTADSDTGAQYAEDAHLRPGCGKFLVKVGGRPGIPVQVHLTAAEKSLKNSNSRWQEGLAQRRARTSTTTIPTGGATAVRATQPGSPS